MAADLFLWRTSNVLDFSSIWTSTTCRRRISRVKGRWSAVTTRTSRRAVKCFTSAPSVRKVVVHYEGGDPQVQNAGAAPVAPSIASWKIRNTKSKERFENCSSRGRSSREREARITARRAHTFRFAEGKFRATFTKLITKTAKFSGAELPWATKIGGREKGSRCATRKRVA